MEAKIKHLEFIQTTISRMSQNSFFLKGWAVTVVAGLLAFSFKELNWKYSLISVVAMFFFWLADSYYLSRERLFIKLYDVVRTKAENEIDFTMDTKNFDGRAVWPKGAFSTTMNVFYGGLVIVHLLAILFVM